MPRSRAAGSWLSRSRCCKNSATFRRNQKRKPRRSSESGRRGGTSCGGEPTRLTRPWPSGSSAGSLSDTEIVIALAGFDRKRSGTCPTRARPHAERQWPMRGCARREIPMTEQVNFIRGNDRISQLAQRPDLAAEVAGVRAEMAEADRTYAMGLAALRQAAELTQVELARRMGVTQAAISRMEQPHDLLLSTLNAYLQAIGGTARMVVRFSDGHEATLNLAELA